MSRAPNLRGFAAAWAALALGFGCDIEGGGTAPPPPTPTATLRLETDASSLSPDTLFPVRIYVQSMKPISALDLALTWTERALDQREGWVYPEAFDDDGGWFLQPVLDQQAGTLDRLVDLRHGSGTGTIGEVHVATVYFYTREIGNIGEIQVTGSMARGNGQAFKVTGDSVTMVVKP